MNFNKIPISSFTSLDEDVSIEYLKRVGDSGIHLFYLVCDLPWLEQPGLDLKSLEKRIDELRQAVPQAQVILRVNLHPPMSWIKKNPDELVRLSNGEILKVGFVSCYYREKNVPFYSLVSEKWQHDAGKELEKLIEKVTCMDNGDIVIGYFMAAGMTGEWGYGTADGFSGEETFDYSIAFKQYFKKWLKRKYCTVEHLHHAWKIEDIDFESIFIPALEQRSGYYAFNRNYDDFVSNDAEIKAGKCDYAIGGFINPDTAMPGLDFLLAWQHGICESIEYFCNIVKNKSKGTLLTGSFHGTLYHAGTRKILLESKNIDFLASPGNYWNRCPGEITNVQPPIDSYFLNNKAFIMEDDTRTHLAAPDISKRFGTFTLEDSLTQLKRDFGRNVCDGFYGWWFDMFIPEKLSKLAANSGNSLDSGGQCWYDDVDILKLFKQQQQIAQLAKTCDRSKISSIAVIFDESSCLLSSINSFEKIFYYWRGNELARLGAPVDFYYQDDLDNLDMPDYKLYIFVNTFMLDSQERERIAKKVKRNNSTVLWLYAAGVCNLDAEQRFSAEHISELTGISIHQDNHLIDPVFCLTESHHAIVDGADKQLIHGCPVRSVLQNHSGEVSKKPFANEQMPNFYPAPDECEVLGRFKANNEPALVCRDFPEWRSIYCGTSLIGSDLLRSIAKSAACHIVCESDDFIFMNKSFLTVHAASDGVKTLHLPTPCHPKEVYTAHDYGSNISIIELKMKRGETKMFHLAE
jgi:hypothetical protein